MRATRRAIDAPTGKPGAGTSPAASMAGETSEAVPSPAQRLQAVLAAAYHPALQSTPEPEVGAWPGWAKGAVLVGGAALSWGLVIGAATLLGRH